MLSKSSRLAWNSTRILLYANSEHHPQRRHQSVLSMETLNPLVKEVEYAVRGKRKDSKEMRQRGMN